MRVNNTRNSTPQGGDTAGVKRILAIALAVLPMIALPAQAGPTDHPSSVFHDPAVGTVLHVGTAAVVHGISVNGEQGGIVRTEVSIDGGATWQFAAGATESWQFSFTPAAPGAVTIQSRAFTVDHVEEPYRAVTYLVDGSAPLNCPCTFWQPDLPNREKAAENDAQPVEVGVKFRPDRDGFITGLSFFRFPANTGPFVGHLWSADGQMLAEATLDADTHIPRVAFGQPVAVQAGQTYVASYFTESGNYAQSVGYFTDPVVQPPFETDADAGVYAYGGGFPTETWQSANYWVSPTFSS